jgi:heat shock protein HtpX
MSRRIVLFVLTNLAILTTLTIICEIFGVGGYLTQEGLDYYSLLIFCTIYGFLTSLVSLACSRFVAKKFMRVKLINAEEEGNLQWLAIMVNDISKRAGLEKCPEVGVFRSDDMNAISGSGKYDKRIGILAGQ